MMMVARTKREAEMSSLSATLRDGFKIKKLSLSEVADIAKAAESSLRQWLNRNSFPEDMVDLLAEIAGLPERLPDLKRRYVFRISRQKVTAVRAAEQSADNITQAMRNFEQRLELLDSSNRLYDEFGLDVLRLFDSLGRNDAFLYWSIDQIPLEMRPGNIRLIVSIAKKIETGSVFCYIIPSNKLLKEFRENNKIRNIPHSDSFLESFMDFRRHIMSQGISESEVDKHLFVFSNENATAFSAPSHKYGLFLPAEDRPARVLARYPTGTRSRNLGLHLPLDVDATDAFMEFAAAAIGSSKEWKKLSHGAKPGAIAGRLSI